ncbi:endonuclease/exonuclease/phosphatase family protein [Brachybacterium sp. AOP43-C2-M15]|uniref:endonuclease/exonuclease/phosphatase family protein n=1 Tax=Brachybacterium sp. AOP43-C2-M15 TaxID=3457661 RepID=UPI004033B1B9
MISWRVATYNIRHGHGDDDRVDLVRTAAEISALGADVIGLQEVDVRFGDRSGHEDQASRLGELLGMQVAFGAAIDRPPHVAGGARRRYGVALLTRHELLDPAMHPLPEHPGCEPLHEPRGVLSAHVRRSDGAELTALVTHLDNLRREHRTAEVQGIVRRAEELDGPVASDGHRARPAVLMGDMNASPDSPELAVLAATGWREAARELERADAAAHSPLRRLGRALPVLGAVLPGRGTAPRPTHPARFPVRRIDALWVRGPLEVESLRVGPRGASDHRPVLATLRSPR